MVGEYRRRHTAVWPEMQEALRATGWHNYSLFLSDEGLLTGYLECTDFAASVKAMGELDVNSQWQAEMAPFFEATNGRKADESMRPLPEIFHID